MMLIQRVKLAGVNEREGLVLMVFWGWVWAVLNRFMPPATMLRRRKWAPVMRRKMAEKWPVIWDFGVCGGVSCGGAATVD